MKRPYLSSDTRGAAMVFGLFFAIFLLGMLWYVLGLTRTIDYRQRMQDASDAAAFSAAVVNARGMNLLALINMTMAAILSVLVGLRLVQTIGYVAIGICFGLAYPTMGASLGPVPLITKMVTQVAKVATKVEDVMPDVLGALHTAGKAVSVVVPVGANLRVISMVAKEYDVATLGVAIPSRFTLPVEDDDFGVLCAHAGELAGYMAMLPVSPILPDTIEDAIGDVAGKIAQAGSDWFCGEGGEPPDLNSDEDTRYIEYPILPKQKRCEDLSKKALDGTLSDSGRDELQRVCDEASIERLASVPNRHGECRRGQPLCPTDCKEESRMSCPPKRAADCEPEDAAKYDALSVELTGRDSVSCGAKKADGRFDYEKTSSFTPYERRLIAAREQCNPTLKANARKRAYTWLERKVVVTYEWRPKVGWVQNPDLTEYGPQALVEHSKDDASKPCDTLRDASEYEGKELRVPVCQGSRICQTPSYTDVYTPEGPCNQPPQPLKGSPLVMREQVTQVTDMISCTEEQDLEKVATERMDVGKSLAENDQGGEQNTSPFRLEEGVWLGGSDFQLRSVIVGKAVPGGREVLELATWGEGTGDTGWVAEAAATTAGILGHIGLAQAEYYFDWRGLDPQPSDQLKDEDVTEWLWHMGWRARLRPFRFTQSKADGPRPEKESGPDAEQMKFMPEVPKTSELDCSDEEGCDDAKQVIDVFGEGDI